MCVCVCWIMSNVDKPVCGGCVVLYMCIWPWSVPKWQRIVFAASDFADTLLLLSSCLIHSIKISGKCFALILPVRITGFLLLYCFIWPADATDWGFVWFFGFYCKLYVIVLSYNHSFYLLYKKKMSQNVYWLVQQVGLQLYHVNRFSRQKSN